MTNQRRNIPEKEKTRREVNRKRENDEEIKTASSSSEGTVTNSKRTEGKSKTCKLLTAIAFRWKGRFHFWCDCPQKMNIIICMKGGHLFHCQCGWMLKKNDDDAGGTEIKEGSKDIKNKQEEESTGRSQA